MTRLPFAARIGAFSLLLGSAGLTGCTDLAGYDLDRAFGYVPWLATLRKDVAIDAHQMPRLPAVGSIPIASPMGDVPDPFDQTELETVAAALTNPLPNTPEVLARGKLQYERSCATCHGPLGAGDGPVVGPGKFPFATAIRDAATAARSDGYLYGVVRVGRGLMPAYGDRMTHEDRWAVVAYMRQLQGGAGAGVAATPSRTPVPPNGAAPPPVTPPAAAADTAAAAPR